MLAFDFRGLGRSPAAADQDLRSLEAARHRDVLGAVRYLRSRGAASVAVVGASMGGDYAAEAAEADPKAIDRLVLLAAGAYTTLTRMRGPKLFIMARDDIIGDNVSATKPETMTAPASVNANSRKSAPVSPP